MASTLTRQRYHILLALSGDDLHGSAIVRVVLEQTEGELHLWPATLYGNLDVLARERLIEELGDAARPPGVSEKRRYYRITAKGARALEAYTEHMAQLVATARRNLRRRGVGETR
jgi:DNA-binding PadR family transcriptional regulator